MNAGEYKIMRRRRDPPVPSIWNGMSQTSDSNREIHGDTQDVIYHFYENGNADALHLESSFQRVGSTIAKRIIGDKDYINKIYAKNIEFGKELASVSNRVLKMDLSRLGVKQLLAEYISLREAWLLFDHINVLPWFVAGDIFNEGVRKVIMENHPDMEDSDFLTLTTPATLSQVMNEELDVLRLVFEAKQDKKVVETFKKEFGTDSIGSLPAPIAKGLAVLEEKYSCIPYGYAGPTIWDIEHYFGRISELLSIDETSLKGRIFELENYGMGVSKRHSEIDKTFSLSQEEHRLCEAMRILAIMTDQRKEYQFRCHAALGKVFNEIAKKLNMPQLSLRHLLPEEIESMHSNPEMLEQIAQRRMQKLFVVEFRRGGCRIIDGDAAEGFRSMLPKDDKGSVMKGEIGSLGSQQVTRGKARVLLSADDVYILEEGEILVATMTTPDYVVAMKKASAIVTDEGGVTCHAAIVARELGIPCVIATHSATRRIRTGDEIEVDIGTGEVRIIKRA